MNPQASWESIIKELLNLQDTEKEIEEMLKMQNNDIGGAGDDQSFKQKMHGKCREFIDKAQNECKAFVEWKIIFSVCNR